MILFVSAGPLEISPNIFHLNLQRDQVRSLEWLQNMTQLRYAPDVCITSWLRFSSLQAEIALRIEHTSFVLVQSQNHDPACLSHLMSFFQPLHHAAQEQVQVKSLIAVGACSACSHMQLGTLLSNCCLNARDAQA